MIRILLLALLFSSSGSFLIAQSPIDFSNYIPSLECAGEIPDVLVQDALEKARETEEDYDDFYTDKEDEELAEVKSEMITLTAMELGSFYRKGQLLFGDPLSQYVGDVKNEVLKSDPELRDAVNVYVLKSTMINAFAMLDGNVYVSIGLLARMENEAELASVLAHESGHVDLKHSMNLLKLAKDLENLEKERGKLSTDDILTLRSTRQVDQEYEADSVSLHFLQNSDYDEAGQAKNLRSLGYGHIPLGEYKLNLADFKMGQFNLPAFYYLDSVNPVEEILESGIKYATHPDLEERIETSVSNRSDKEGKAFVLKSQIEFKDFVTMCKFELVDLYMVDRNYAESLILTMSLLQNYPNNKYLQISKLRALYGLSKYQNHKALSSSFRGFSDVQGDAQRLYFLLKYLNAQQLSTISSALLIDYINENPDNTFAQQLAQNLLKDLLVTKKVKWDDYLNMEEAQAFQADLNTKLAALDESVSTRKKMSYGRMNYTIGFAHLKEDSTLTDMFTYAHEYADSLASFERKDVDEKNKVYEERRTNYGEVSIPRGVKVVIADPIVSYAYKSSKMDDYIEENRELEAEFRKYLLNYIDTNDRVENGFVNDLNYDEIDQYNRMCDFRKVSNEKLNQIGRVGLIPTSLYEVDPDDQVYLMDIATLRPAKGACYFYYYLMDMQTGKIKHFHFEKIGSSTKRLLKAVDEQMKKIQYN